MNLFFSRSRSITSLQRLLLILPYTVIQFTQHQHQIKNSFHFGNLSSESGKLQLKVNPKADHDYFPASETEGNEVKGQRLLKSIDDQDQGR